MTEPTRHLEARTVAARLRQRLSPGCQHEGARIDRSARRLEPEPAVLLGHPMNPCACLEVDTRRMHFAQQRVDHVARAVRVGKQLAVRFLVQWHTDRHKPGNRLRG